MGLSFLNYEKIVLDKMSSEVSSRRHMPSYYHGPIQKMWLCSEDRGSAKGSVAGLVKISKRQRGGIVGVLALFPSGCLPIPFIRKASLWLLSHHLIGRSIDALEGKV